jgi:hypothetical protein
MKVSSVTVFCKQPTCPSSEALLAYQSERLGLEQEARMALHLAGCDFCGAELQLLTEHPPSVEEECALTDIPVSLRRLAEALLGRVSLTLETFAETTYEKERLTLTDA